MNICPKCKGRATKLFSINSGEFICQQCDHVYFKEIACVVCEKPMRDKGKGFTMDASCQRRFDWALKHQYNPNRAETPKKGGE